MGVFVTFGRSQVVACIDFNSMMMTTGMTIRKVVVVVVMVVGVVVVGVVVVGVVAVAGGGGGDGDRDDGNDGNNDNGECTDGPDVREDALLLPLECLR